MDRAGNVPGGIVSEVRNIHSQKLYMVSAAPEIGQDYWSTAVVPMVQRKALFGFIKLNVPDVHHQLASFIRNSVEDAHAAHAHVRHVVTAIREEEVV